MNRRGLFASIAAVLVAPKPHLNPTPPQPPKPCSRCGGTGRIAVVDETDPALWFGFFSGGDLGRGGRDTFRMLDCPRCTVLVAYE